jgi:hypothetical protein
MAVTPGPRLWSKTIRSRREEGGLAERPEPLQELPDEHAPGLDCGHGVEAGASVETEHDAT